MTAFGMFVLTLMTVLGSMILGWLARLYCVRNGIGQLGAAVKSQIAKRRSAGEGTKVIGTVAAGTAAVSLGGEAEDTAREAAEHRSDSASAAASAATLATLSSGTSTDASRGGADKTSERSASGAGTGAAATAAAPARETNDRATPGGSERSEQSGSPSGSKATAALPKSSSDASAGVGDPKKLAELEASRAEARQLRTRLGLSADDEGVAGDEHASLDSRLGASRTDTRDLRQQLWSKTKSDEDAAAAEAKKEADQKAAAEAQKVADAQADADAKKAADEKAAAKTTRSAAGDGLAAASMSGAHDSGDGDTASEQANTIDIPKALSAEEAEAERLLAEGGDIPPPANRLDGPRAGQAADDLSRINGIGPKIAGKLNDQGIYYFDQIAEFSGSDLAWADIELDFKGRAVRDRWIPQARGLMGSDSGASSDTNRMKHHVDVHVGQRIRKRSSTDESAAPSNLLDQPIEGRTPDDLTRIKGVGPKIKDQLNDKGVYYFSQIADFTEADQAWADEALGFPGRVARDDWVPQAKGFAAEPPSSPDATGETGRGARLNVLANAGRELGSLSGDDGPGEMSAAEAEAMRLIDSGEFVADDSNRPASLLASASEGGKDDLKLIKGVGPKLEDLLNSLGIFYFRQIAAFAPTDIAWVDSKLRFRGRMVRDHWVDQAKKMN